VNQWEEEKDLMLFRYWLKIEGHFTYEFVTYVKKTQDWWHYPTELYAHTHKHQPDPVM
jgi:hypothetical protein